MKYLTALLLMISFNTSAEIKVQRKYFCELVQENIVTEFRVGNCYTFTNGVSDVEITKIWFTNEVSQFSKKNNMFWRTGAS